MVTSTSIRFLEGRLRTYRRTWRGSVFTTFLNPILFLSAMGLGVGSLVNNNIGHDVLGGIAYITFLAPGLLAATTMQVATNDASWPVMAGIKWQRTYEAALATPLNASALVYGQLCFIVLRVTFTGFAYSLVMAVMASVPFPGALLSVIPGLLTGIACAAPVMAFTASREGAEPLSALVRFAIMPMFLFSGTFFPVSQLPGWLQPIAHATPLWHGVELTRAAALSVATTTPAAVSILYLLAWAALGTWLAVRILNNRMTK